MGGGGEGGFVGWRLIVVRKFHLVRFSDLLRNKKALNFANSNMKVCIEWPFWPCSGCPISLLSVFSKIIEKVMYQRFYKLLEKHEIYILCNLVFVLVILSTMPWLV